MASNIDNKSQLIKQEGYFTISSITERAAF